MGANVSEVDVVILAAGKGTRMKSEEPKVLHSLAGRPMLAYILDVAAAVCAHPPIVVVGHEKEKVQNAFSDREVRWVEQHEQLGTGHAVLACSSELEKNAGPVVVLNADQPLITEARIRDMLGVFERENPAAVMLTAELEDPTNFGRIVRDESGKLLKIVEEHDAGPEERSICEVNGGAYIFDKEKLLARLKNLDTDNAQGEYYLTDVIHQLIGENQAVMPLMTPCCEEILSVTTRWDVQRIWPIIMGRYMKHLAEECGVTIVAPENTYIEPGALIGQDTVILPFTVIERDVKIGRHCRVGPFSHLRKGTVLEDYSEIGNFTETKNTHLGERSKAKHLSYLGDAQIGKKVNVGAGTICANYDGKNKHKTEIGDGTHVGSGTIFVAPVKTGKDAVTGAGAVVTSGRDVSDGETVVGVPAESLPKRRKKGKKK
jgi:bifunctional UDP-N-acetylglucosamine pyrophosphorylase/glucosamine-1-phosphate N-acetyltransferase